MVAEGKTTSSALHDTTELAKGAEALGYTRIWVAEHHNLATVASTVPAILVAHLAANTSTIKVGAGGVMLPNHAPLAIAEQFAILEALHPGRIDLGIGRAPGTDRATAVALRRTQDHREEEHFPRNLLDVMGLLGDQRTERGLWQQFRATPVAGSNPSVILLGSSGFSAQLAGVLGLPFSFAHHFDMGGTTEAVELYRQSFDPSPILDEPYVIVSASTIAADTAETAAWLAGPSRLRRYGMRNGRLHPLLSPDEAAAHEDFAPATAMATNSLLGTADEVVAGMDDLVAMTGASELMLHTATHGLAERLRSLELIAERWSSIDTTEVA
ncbi:MAG: LLM class flavin-dependent oxidoreductase [Actinomycetia bacterium]|nr:LLM class flavin-dependent oxidoreductase [Actinomycetes bacterium]MCP4228439.1 LLM class flavin-dependent oxidoreductase [Actinomycetes bacterium]MCP5030775.1 LLM class flavin-dependent oxidoreductase [Actinomycetes bacterium]